jgi:2-iminobutanoate/2-iminopropanoate deaminase
MKKEIIFASTAPKAIGPYSQAVALDQLIFTSGQLPIDPSTGAFPPGGIKAQAKQSLLNVQAILEAAGSSMEKIIKTTVFLSDIADFAGMNEVYAEFFPQEGCPARSAVQVAALPKNAKIEIEVIAQR